MTFSGLQQDSSIDIKGKAGFRTESQEGANESKRNSEKRGEGSQKYKERIKANKTTSGIQRTEAQPDQRFESANGSRRDDDARS